MKGLTNKEPLFLHVVKYCVGLTFVAGVSTLVVYAGHGWTWPSEINSVALNVPEFVATIVLLTLVIGICVDVWKRRNLTKRQFGESK